MQSKRRKNWVRVCSIAAAAQVLFPIAATQATPEPTSAPAIAHRTAQPSPLSLSPIQVAIVERDLVDRH